MQQEKLTSSADTKLRRHKTQKHNNATNKPKSYVIDRKNASDDAKEACDALRKNCVPPDSNDTNIGVYKKLRKKRKLIIVDEEAEVQRRKYDRYSKIVLAFFAVIAVVISIAILYNYISSTDFGQMVIYRITGTPINESGDYIYGSFDDMVTIGDSHDRALEILGYPDLPEEQNGILYLHYGDSYVALENDIVTAFYKADENFKVTIGTACEGVNRIIFVGDDAKRVVDMLGTPNQYMKKTWIYHGMTVDYTRTNYEKGKDLKIQFSDNYKVESITFEQ